MTPHGPLAQRHSPPRLPFCVFLLLRFHWLLFNTHMHDADGFCNWIINCEADAHLGPVCVCVQVCIKGEDADKGWI